MEIIPVLDLCRGKAVKARAGVRANYKPMPVPDRKNAEPLLKQPLKAPCIRAAVSAVDAADPQLQAMLITASLAERARFSTFYIADLDSIADPTSTINHPALISICKVLACAQVHKIWLDAGQAHYLKDFSLMAKTYGVLVEAVCGSESMTTIAQPIPRSGILSLDFRDGHFCGPHQWEKDAAQWPERVIVMELAAVGMEGGPAYSRLNEVQACVKASQRKDIAVYVAGGVRNKADLETLEQRAVAGVLIATALHQENIDSATLEHYGCLPAAQSSKNLVHTSPAVSTAMGA